MNNIAQFLLRIYQRLISPVFYGLGVRCRFYPSCSSYSLECFKNHNFINASFFTMRRILKCSPLHNGGIDFPPVFQEKDQK